MTWSMINFRFGDTCNNILALVDLILTLPVSSAEAERGFSLMKRKKKDWRSRLNSSTVSDLMCIVLHMPKVGQYDPTEAINLWNSASIRSKRPDIQPYESRSSSFVKDSASKSPKVGGLESESPTKNAAASNADSQSLSETETVSQHY